MVPIRLAVIFDNMHPSTDWLDHTQKKQGADHLKWNRAQEGARGSKALEASISVVKSCFPSSRLSRTGAVGNQRNAAFAVSSASTEDRHNTTWMLGNRQDCNTAWHGLAQHEAAAAEAVGWLGMFCYPPALGFDVWPCISDICSCSCPWKCAAAATCSLNECCLPDYNQKPAGQCAVCVCGGVCR